MPTPRALLPAPVPLLLSPPVPLPAAFAGDWAGVAVIYDLDRLFDWDLTAPTLLAAVRAANLALEATEPGPAQAAELVRLQHETAAIIAAHLVYTLVDGNVPPPAREDVAAWQALSRTVVQWIAYPGKLAAGQAAMAPFTPAASPSSGSTASS